MIQVTRKDGKESLENLIRRFNKKVQQSGVMAAARKQEAYEKPMSRRERRTKAIRRKQTRDEKLYKMRLGIK